MNMNEADYILNYILDHYPNISDVNITAGKPIQVEVDSELIPVTFPTPINRLTPYQTELFAIQLLQHDRRATRLLLEEGSTDLSYAIEEKARFRVNIFSGRGSYAIVMRRLATYIPAVEELHLPTISHEITDSEQAHHSRSGSNLS